MNFSFDKNYVVEDFILNTTWENLPEQIQARAIVCSVDLMIALLLGSKGKQFSAGIKMAENNFKDGNVAVVGCAKTFGLLGAVVAMAHASNSFDIDDGHNMIKGHPGTSFVAGVLAAAYKENISYKEYLTTLVVCYEVAVRCGLAVQDHYGYLHSTGTYGAFGTAAGMGRIMRFSRELLSNALSVAEFHAPLTPVMRSVQYPSMNKDGVPFGALVGAAAVLETEAGTTGCGHILEMPQYKDMVASLGKKYEIMNLYFKPFTCCRWAHQEHKFASDEVESVKVHTFDSAAKLSKKIPTTTDEAQYNIAWPVAAAIVCGDVGIEQVWEPALTNKKILDMMQRLTFDVDSKLDSQFPEKRLAQVEIQLKNGQNFQSKIYAAPGEHTDNIDLAWEKKKFMLRTAAILTREQQEKVFNILTGALDSKMKYIVQKINMNY